MHNDKPVYLMGDFNINLLNMDLHTLANEFLNINKLCRHTHCITLE